MHHLSMIQALYLWGELWQAYYGRNGFGGDTAEVYAYKLMPHSPMLDSSYRDVESFAQYRKEAYTNAAIALHEVCVLFEEQKEVDVLIDGLTLSEWMQGVMTGQIVFEHRVHVKVEG